MSINIAFYGSECFDLLHYVSRVLKACNISSIMIDWSADQSLYNSVPNPGIQENEVIDYPREGQYRAILGEWQKSLLRSAAGCQPLTADVPITAPS